MREGKSETGEELIYELEKLRSRVAGLEERCKKAEEALERSEARFRDLYSNTIEGIFQTSPEGQLLSANETLARWYGADSPEQMVEGLGDIESQLYVNCEDRAVLKRILEKDGAAPDFEVRLYDRAKRVRWLSLRVRAIRDEEGRIIRHDGFAQDITLRKEMEAALREEKETLRTILENLPIGVVLFNEIGVLLYRNPEFTRITGYTTRDVPTVIEFFQKAFPDPVYREKTLELFEKDRFSEVGTVVDREGAITCKDGTVRDMDARVCFLDDLRVVVFRDVTERKQAEKALRESEEKYRDTVENSLVASYIIQDGLFRFVNRRFCELWGYSYDELVDVLGPKDITYPDDIEMTEENVQKRITGELERIDYNFRSVKKDETVMPMKVLGSRITYRGRPAAAGSIIDMTREIELENERRQAERALRESEKEYRTVVENSLVGFYIIQDGLFRFVNQRFCEMVGYSYDEIVDVLDPAEITYPEDRALIAENIRKRTAGEMPTGEYNFRSLRKDGKVTTLKVLGSRIMYRGRPAAAGSIIDMTSQIELETKLRQAQKMEAIGTLAGGIAHDFNNILTVITGYGALLQMHIGEGDPLQEFTENILSAAQTAGRLTRGLLAFTRQQPAVLGALYINDTIRQTEKLLRRLITEDIVLKTQLSSPDIVVMANASQVDQILFNLTANARDAMPKGGALTIETKRIVMDEQFIRMHGFGKPGTYALLSISDTGIGMDGKTVEQIFNPFFTTKEVGKGTGLGLSTVYGIVDQHDGYINVYSEPNIGTTFHIYIPAVSTTFEVGPVPSAEINGGTETVLIAEDNSKVRHILSETLGLYGYKVIEAEDGDAATALFERHGQIDILILDSVMPKKNGRQAYEEIRKMKPDVRVIFISGYTKDIILDKGIRGEEFPFVSKPVAPRDLLRVVRETLDKK